MNLHDGTKYKVFILFAAIRINLFHVQRGCVIIQLRFLLVVWASTHQLQGFQQCTAPAPRTNDVTNTPLSAAQQGHSSLSSLQALHPSRLSET